MRYSQIQHRESAGSFSRIERVRRPGGDIFEDDASASAAPVSHLIAAECHTREQLDRIVGRTGRHTHAYRLVYENRVEDGYAACWHAIDAPMPSSTETAGVAVPYQRMTH